MKKIFITIIIGLLSCKPTPEFNMNGKDYYTVRRCLDYKSETVWEYHYGWNPFNNKFNYHWGPHRKNTCLQYKTDTIEIK